MHFVYVSELFFPAFPVLPPSLPFFTSLVVHVDRPPRCFYFSASSPPRAPKFSLKPPRAPLYSASCTSVFPNRGYFSIIALFLGCPPHSLTSLPPLFLHPLSLTLLIQVFAFIFFSPDCFFPFLFVYSRILPPPIE